MPKKKNEKVKISSINRSRESKIMPKKKKENLFANPIVIGALITGIVTLAVAVIQYANSINTVTLPARITQTAETDMYLSMQVTLKKNLSEQYQLERNDDVNGVYSFELPANTFRVERNPFAYGDFYISNDFTIETQFRYFGASNKDVINWIDVYDHFGRQMVEIPAHEVAFSAPGNLLRSENTGKLEHSTLFEFEGIPDLFATRPDFIPTPDVNNLPIMKEMFLIEEKDNVWAFFIVSGQKEKYDSWRDMILYMTSTFQWDANRAKQFTYPSDLGK